MSEFKIACPNCQQHIACDESYAGLQISCPTCGAPMKLPGERIAAAAPSEASGACPKCEAPLARDAVLCTHCGYNLRTEASARPTRVSRQRRKSSRSVTGSGSLLPKLAGISAIVGLLAAVGFAVFASLPPEASKFMLSLEVFLIGTGAALSFLCGLMILINAFRESIWWGLGFFAPLVGGIVSLVFVIKHWGQNGRLFLLNLGGVLLATVGIVLFGATGFQNAMASLEASMDEGEASATFTDPAESLDTDVMLLITFESEASWNGATAEGVLSGVNYDRSFPAVLSTVSDFDAPYQSQLSFTLLSPSDLDSSLRTIAQSRGVRKVEDFNEKIARMMAEKFKEAFSK